SAAHVGAGLAGVFDPEIGEPPDRDCLDHWTGALREVLAHAPAGEHAPAATLLALLAWWSGDGAIAGCWLAMALAANPAYTFAELLSATLDAGLPPGWARRPAAQDAALRQVRGERSAAAVSPDRSEVALPVVVGFVDSPEGQAALAAAVRESASRDGKVVVVLSGPRGVPDPELDLVADRVRAELDSSGVRHE